MNKNVGSQWRHYKRGEIYFVLLEAKRESDLEYLFVYAQLKGNNPLNRLLLRSVLFVLHLLIDKVWVRSEDDFLSSVKVGDGDQKVRRFSRAD